jgi:RNA-directed DNA polymerase
MSKSKKPKPATVPFRATQAGETQAQFPFGEESSRWSWAESSIWTDRMLTALENGVKGGKWFSLIDKVYSPKNLESAATEVARNGGAAGVDRVTIEMFMDRKEANLNRLSQALQTGTYVPQAVMRTWIPKPGTREQRPLGIPTVSDRVVQNALRHALEPIFERDFAEHSYGFRPGRSCIDALARVETLLEGGYTHVVDADLKGYFDTIDHGILMERIEEKVSDGRVLNLLRQMLQQGIFEEGATRTPEQGSPQGSVLSPLLSNIYLNPLDHLLAEHGFAMVRYADDFVVLCRSRTEADAALELIRSWVTEARLTLHPTKTRIVDAVSEGFDFLGYHFERGYRWPRTKSLQKLKDTVRAQTKRTRGTSLKAIVADLNRTLPGWFGYFQYSLWTTFHDLDKWIRMRLRSILRKRRKQHGRGRGSDHQRWPNAYFAELGLFSLEKAHVSVSQSVTR